MKNTSLFLVGSLFIILSTCLSCDYFGEVEYSIDKRLQPYVDKFYEEAAQRGVALRTDNLKVTLRDDMSQVGLTVRDKIVYINMSMYNGYDASDHYSEEIEFIVFHELGHALLHLEHRPAPSIMEKSSPIRAYVGKPEVRKKFMDDLFR